MARRVSPRTRPGDERCDRLREISESRGELTGCSALIDVCVPSADIRERDFQSDVCLDELRDLKQTLTEL